MSSCSEKMLQKTGFANVSEIFLDTKEVEMFLKRNPASVPSEISATIAKMIALTREVGYKLAAPKACGCSKTETVATPGLKAGFPT